MSARVTTSPNVTTELPKRTELPMALPEPTVWQLPMRLLRQTSASTQGLRSSLSPLAWVVLCLSLPLWSLQLAAQDSANPNGATQKSKPLTTSIPSQAPKPPKTVTFQLYHVEASQQPAPSVPKQLQKFARQLKQVKSNHFTMLGKVKTLKLTVGKAQRVTLPKKLGSAQILLNADGSVSLVLIPTGKPKDRISTKTRRFPMFSLTPKSKFPVGKGSYLLIVDKTAK